LNNKIKISNPLKQSKKSKDIKNINPLLEKRKKAYQCLKNLEGKSHLDLNAVAVAVA